MPEVTLFGQEEAKETVTQVMNETWCLEQELFD